MYELDVLIYRNIMHRLNCNYSHRGSTYIIDILFLFYSINIYKYIYALVHASNLYGSRMKSCLMLFYKSALLVLNFAGTIDAINLL